MDHEKRFVAIIMAGGKGQRFWPLSTESRPKQFLDLGQDGRTLLQSTYDRILPLVGSPSNVFITTASQYVHLVREQLPHLSAENILVEPTGRDSAPAVAYATLEIEGRLGPCTCGVFSADHRILDSHRFHEVIEQAKYLAESEGGLVTVGINPTQPATGYGYIEQGSSVGPGFKVKQFIEKPNSEKAQQFLDGGRHFWNAGIFVWESSVVLAELDRHSPDLMKALRRARDSNTVSAVFPSLPKISVDYALMERTDKAYVVPGNFDWDDIGDWAALERLLGRSPDGANTVVGQHVGLEARGNIIYTESPDDVVVTLGVENLVVVKRGNTVLLLPKNRVQDLKRLLEDERLADVVLV